MDSSGAMRELREIALSETEDDLPTVTFQKPRKSCSKQIEGWDIHQGHIT